MPHAPERSTGVLSPTRPDSSPTTIMLTSYAVKWVKGKNGKGKKATEKRATKSWAMGKFGNGKRTTG